MNPTLKEPGPPPPGMLTQSEEKIGEDDIDLVSCKIPMENLQKLAKYLGISRDMSEVK